LSEPWPVTPKIIFKELGVRPVLTGVGYGLGAIAMTCAPLGLPSTEMVPLLPHFALVFLTGQAALSVGGAVGTITGAKRCLIEGRWITKALPISTVADAVASKTSLSDQALHDLALKLRDGLHHPPFVPRLAGPIWRLVMNQAVPLDSLILVPSRIVELLKKNNTSNVGVVVESVMVGLVAEGLDRVQSRVRMSGLAGVFLLFTGGTMLLVKIWPPPVEKEEENL